MATSSHGVCTKLNLALNAAYISGCASLVAYPRFACADHKLKTGGLGLRQRALRTAFSVRNAFFIVIWFMCRHAVHPVSDIHFGPEMKINAVRPLDSRDCSTDWNVNRPLSRGANFWLKTHTNKYYVVVSAGKWRPQVWKMRKNIVGREKLLIAAPRCCEQVLAKLFLFPVIVNFAPFS